MPLLWLATGFGLGYVPVAPGTAGALLGLPLAWGMLQLPTAGFVAVQVLLLAVGVPLCTQAARRLAQRNPSESDHDPSAVVYDEYATVPACLFLLPASATILFAGFVLHRLMDVVKPWPICLAERLPRGWGIMADDLVAAVFANVLLHAARAIGWL